MNKELAFNAFKEILVEGEVLIDEPMKKHTSFKIGGPVDILVIPGNLEEIIASIKLCKDKNINYMIMGNGSNLLVKDKGIRGIIIKIADRFKNIETQEDKMIVEAGALLSTISKFDIRTALYNVEEIWQIPPPRPSTTWPFEYIFASLYPAAIVLSPNVLL